MALTREEAIKRFEAFGEEREIPQEMLASVAGGAETEENMRIVADVYKNIFQATLEYAIEVNRGYGYTDEMVEKFKVIWEQV